MGILTQGYGAGAQGAANDSFAWSKAATGLSAAGDVFGGIGGYQLANYQAAVAANNAKIMQQNAESSYQAGDYEQQVQGLKTSQVIGAQRAGYGASNIDVNVGSPTNVEQSTRLVGAMDQAMIRFKAAKEAAGYQLAAASETAQSKLDQMAGTGALVGGLFKAGSSIIGGASSLAGRYAQWQLQSAPQGVGP
jgi:hypothetical protein